MATCLFCPNGQCSHKRRERFSNIHYLVGRQKFVMYLKCIFGYNPNPRWPAKSMYAPCICSPNQQWQQSSLLTCNGFIDACINNFVGQSIEYKIFEHSTSGRGCLLNIGDVRQAYNGVQQKCSISNLEEGDIIWTYPHNSTTYNHVMFYIGNNKVVGFNHPSTQYKNGIYNITDLYRISHVEEEECDILTAFNDNRALYIDKLSFNLI